MKIAHFSRFGPHSCGMYETVKDLILSERMVGIDAQFVDCFSEDGKSVREGLVDGQITTAPLDWALKNADVIIRHTVVPESVYKTNKPVIMALHGRPENSCRLEQLNISPTLTSIRGAASNGKHQAFMTFWEDFVYYWQWITGKNIHYIPAPVNLDDYTIEGDKYDFGQFKAKVNLIIADIWREDSIPFNLIFAAQYFKEQYCDDTKLHIYAAPVKEKFIQFLAPMQKRGVIGEVCGTIDILDKIYRSADILLTPNIIATRIIRESMASGLPIVAPCGCKYTQYTADPRDYKEFARQMNKCFEETTSGGKAEIRNKASQLFNQKNTGHAMKKLCENVIGNRRYSSMSITRKEWERICDAIKAYKVGKVVEFGSGETTKLFVKLGMIVDSLETIKEFADTMKKKVPKANIILWDGKTIQKINGDIAFIDGPHYGKNRETAYKSVAESNIPIVICHDMSREEDMQWVKKYFSDWNKISETNNMLILKKPLNKFVLSKSEITSVGLEYCSMVNNDEYKAQRMKRRTERPVELQFLFKHLATYYPLTVLDIGSGLSSLPHLMSMCGFEVTAIDAYDGWPSDILNRHFKVDKVNILNPEIKRHFDFISCISTLEHILEHEIAVKNMLNLLNPDGKLIITVPYNENEYVSNIYDAKGSGYGNKEMYGCQVFSRKEIDSWDVNIIEQEYWKCFYGKYWTFGRQYYPPIKSSKNEQHDLTFLLVTQKGNF